MCALILIFFRDFNWFAQIGGQHSIIWDGCISITHRRVFQLDRNGSVFVGHTSQSLTQYFGLCFPARRLQYIGLLCSYPGSLNCQDKVGRKYVEMFIAWIFTWCGRFGCFCSGIIEFRQDIYRDDEFWVFYCKCV